MKVLVVEDERYLAQMIKKGLESDGYAVDVEYNGEDGYNTASAFSYDVILLDIMMPGMSGIEVCQKLRADKNNTPILMLTALDQPKEVIVGLDTGADDYLSKPFSFSVLQARIRALMRRPQMVVSNQIIVGDLTLDTVEKTVSRAGKSIQLSAKEFAILEYMMRNQGRVLSRETIMAHVWDFDSNILPNNLEVFIGRLRKKIDKPFGKPLFHTVHGFGYKLASEP